MFVIGIGAGNPDYVTVQAINALNKVDVFFVMDKGREKEDLVRLRREICERYIKNKSYRTVETADPPRDRHARHLLIAIRLGRVKINLHRHVPLLDLAIGRRAILSRDRLLLVGRGALARGAICRAHLISPAGSSRIVCPGLDRRDRRTEAPQRGTGVWTQPAHSRGQRGAGDQVDDVVLA